MRACLETQKLEQLEARRFELFHKDVCFQRAYGFGETRVATLALLTFTALSGWRSCGVSRATPSISEVRQRSCRYCDTSVHLDSHFIWQATESYVERGRAFGLISHEGSLNSLQPLCAVSGGVEDIFGPAIFMKLGMRQLAST
jgi:hypothetical protein